LLGELPKVFGKEFLVGYFLSAAILVVAGIVSADLSGTMSLLSFLKKAFIEADEKKLAIHLSITLILVWAFATFLMVINFKLIRALEGYGILNPARLLKWRSLHIFDKLNARINWISAQKKPLSEDHLTERRRLRMRLGNEFPEARHLVLPTRFGNIVRAFERYPQVIYNIDAIRSWTRLQAVLPDGYKGSLEAAKAILDFFVNLWFGATLIATIALLRVAFAAKVGLEARSMLALIAIAIFGILSAIFAAKSAQSAAAQWGELVKGAFDLYRGDLCRQLGFELPRSIERERQMWAPICRTMIYRQARYAEQFTIFRPLADRRTD
jgi:hypothetical protein